MQDPACETSNSLAPRKGNRLGIAVFGAVTVLFCSGATQCGPTGGEVAGAAVGIGAGIAVIVVVAVNATHHSITGCVVSGPNGPELQTSNRRYALEGDAASIQVGDRVKISGSRVKRTKDQTGDQVYRVEKLRKDYGPCPMGKSAS